MSGNKEPEVKKEIEIIVDSSDDAGTMTTGESVPVEMPPVEPEPAPIPENVLPKECKPVERVPVPNPMCELEYSFDLADRISDEVISVLACDDVGDLFYDGEAKALKGTPNTSRNYWMEIELPDKVLRLECYINNNPRLLWNDIPSDQKVKPDKDYNAILSPELDIVGVSHRGRMHANRGTYRDDDFFIDKVGEFTLSIVADGAGSAPLSSTGSKVLCEEAGAYYAKLVESKQDTLLTLLKGQQQPGNLMGDSKLMACLYEIFPSVAFYGKKLLSKLSDNNNIPLKHYHTTALISMTAKIASDRYFCAAFQIGDGITVALTDQHLELLGKGDSGNFPGETVFITSSGVFDNATELLQRIHCYLTREKLTVISMTDGITDSYFKNCPNLNNLKRWQQLITDVTDANGVLKPAAEICDWLNYYVDQEHDDRTMSIVMYK